MVPARRISLDDNELTGHRKKISALEAVYLVLQMPLRRSSRDFQFISTSPPEERTFLLTRLDKLKELPDNSTDVESDNIIYKRYQSRAKQLEKLCLADFVATFNCVKDEQADTGNATYEPSLTGINDFLPETNFEDNTDDDPNSIHVTKSLCETNEYILKGGMKLVKRKKPKIICTEHINKQDSALQRKPSELFGCFYSRNNKQHKQYDLLYCIGIFPRNDDEELRLKRMSNDDYYALDRSLNEQQRQFFYHVLHSIKTKDNPIRLFLSGGAGVGKSTVTNALYEALITYLNSIKGENPDKVKVVKTAPTGKAAFDINGNTLHFAFKIPANRGFKYCALDSDRFNTIRSQLKELMLIFIDEISLVGSGMFNFLNLRLQQIMGTKEPFGGIILITVRDLFRLKPVFDKWIFQNSQTGYNALAKLDNFIFQLPKLTRVDIAIKFLWAYPRGHKPIPNSGLASSIQGLNPTSKWQRNREFVWQIVKLSLTCDPSHEIRKRLAMDSLLWSSTPIVPLMKNNCCIFVAP
ncbi:uncharacterized protein [Montipora capricornis]|uniref:uncharacterized protein n=1 Tax=Montipora capricornis TaxID=246305 RepID=UPI0035F1639D